MKKIILSCKRTINDFLTSDKKFCAGQKLFCPGQICFCPRQNFFVRAEGRGINVHLNESVHISFYDDYAINNSANIIAEMFHSNYFFHERLR